MDLNGVSCGAAWGSDNTGTYLCAGPSGTSLLSSIVPSINSRPRTAFSDEAMYVVFVRNFSEVMYASVDSSGVAIEPIPDCGTPAAPFEVVAKESYLVCVNGDSSSLLKRSADGVWTRQALVQPDSASLSALSAVSSGEVFGVFGASIPFKPDETHFVGSSKIELRLVSLSGATASLTLRILGYSNGFGLLDFKFLPDGRFAVLAVEQTDSLEGVATLQLILLTGRADQDSLRREILSPLNGQRFRGRLHSEPNGTIHIAWFEFLATDGLATTRRLGYARIESSRSDPEIILFGGESEDLLGGFLGNDLMFDMLRLDIDIDGRPVARGLLTGPGANVNPLATVLLPKCR